jgi:hypothetical protein
LHSSIDKFKSGQNRVSNLSKTPVAFRPSSGKMQMQTNKKRSER